MVEGVLVSDQVVGCDEVVRVFEGRALLRRIEWDFQEGLVLYLFEPAPLKICRAIPEAPKAALQP